MANLYDPSTKEQVSLTGNFYQRTIMILFILSGMHLYLIGAMADTFTLIPIGGLSFNLSLYNSVIGFLADYFIIGFRIILPIFAVILIVNCAMGIMTKVAPQIHMFSVGMQIKILIGLLVLFMTIVLLPNLADYLFDEMKVMVAEVIRGMS
jgi:flagellar biosynthetic protein FliR